MANPSIIQNTILPVPDGQAVFPWPQGVDLNHTALNNQFIQLQNTLNNLSSALGLIQTEGTNGGPVGITINWAGGSIVTAGDYIIELHSPYDWTLTSMDYGIGTNGGGITATLQNNGANITGITGINVFTFGVQNAVATGNNFIAKGDKLELLITGVIGSPTDTVLCINGTRSGSAPSNTAMVIATAQDGSQFITSDGTNIVFTVIS